MVISTERNAYDKIPEHEIIIATAQVIIHPSQGDDEQGLYQDTEYSIGGAHY